MALFWSPSTSPISPVRCHKNSAISKPFVSENLISTINISRISKISISASPNFSNPNPSLQRFHCCTSSSSRSSSSMESNKSPFTIIFVKGLPQSTSEGTLNTAFSQFGEVSRVKIITDKKSKQPLGFAYIWFTSMESAQMAVKEMNGKVKRRQLYFDRYQQFVLKDDFLDLENGSLFSFLMAGLFWSQLRGLDLARPNQGQHRTSSNPSNL